MNPDITVMVFIIGWTDQLGEGLKNFTINHTDHSNLADARSLCCCRFEIDGCKSIGTHRRTTYRTAGIVQEG